MITFSLDQRSSQRVQQGYPWVFRSDVLNAKDFDNEISGSICLFANQHGQVIATGYANPKTQLMGRVLSSGTAKIDQGFFENKFRAALAWRQQCFPQVQECYRLVHSESDGLPGLIIDRFDDTLVVQVNTSGM